LSLPEARTLERYFAVSYLGFAVLFGAFSARAFEVANADDRLLVIGLLFGYGAGVAAGISFRPQIAIAAIAVAVVPTMVTAALMPSPIYWVLAGLLTLFLGGGISSMLNRYRRASESITMRRMFASLARSDALTGLPNRLALAERFGKLTRASDHTLAVHCLDLDRFKPVNDRYGHPVGDQLLHAVAERLTGLLRGGDFAARIGGDEFVVVQVAVANQSEADLLARRIVRALSQPFLIGSDWISIGTSVGFALSSEKRRDLEQLIRLADDALLSAKHSGGGTVSFDLKQVS
jgi:diguanylate cyclase (GGDEF)-like protein